jgi:aminoglycoside phosphotransferase (APT) family kinase protein
MSESDEDRAIEEATGEVPPPMKMHADEVEIDVPLVQRLLAGQFPEWADRPIRPVLPRGTDNALFRIGDDMVARLPRLERTAWTLEKERHWLPLLAPLLPVAVPIPLAEGHPTEEYPFPWSVYAWLEGENPPVESIANTEQFAADLASFIAALQRIDASAGPPPGEHNFLRGAPLAALDEDARAAISALDHEMDANVLISAWEDALRAPEWEASPVWVHGDLDVRNLLVTDGRLSGVIDFGGLGVGDPASDVMVAWKVLNPDTRETFRTMLAVDDATWARSRGWVLYQAVSALSYYTLETNPTLVLQAQKWLEEILRA